MINDMRTLAVSKKHSSGIKLASNTVTRVTLIGNARITTSYDDQRKTLRLQNTLYVPELRTNLISVLKIVDRNHIVLFTKDRAYLKDLNERVIFLADREGDLYFVRETGEEARVTTQKDKSPMEWYRRFGHLNMSDLNKMIKNQLAKGIKARRLDDYFTCDACIAGKITAKPFPICAI